MGVGPGVICPRCGEDKQPGDFPKNRRTRSGYGTYCKLCHNARNKETIERLHGASSRHYHLTQRYGVTAAQVQEMVDAQDGLCTICGVAPATQVDHHHATGAFRGILCPDCNAGLGAFGDDPALLFAAVDYLHPVNAQEWAS